MRVDAFDFELPPDRIALEPAHPRDSARMLVVAPGGGLMDARVSDLPDFLRPGDALVVNDTRVIAARLDGIRVRGEAVAGVEATLIKRIDDCRWRALVKPAKKLRVGERIRFGEASESMACLLAALDAEVEEKGEAGEVTLRFDFSGAALDEAIDRLGMAPLPPYISARRAPVEKDRADYQTMFAARDGAVAAPTAGLHFTPRLIESLLARGVSLHRVTLHVGAGTFLPVKAEDTEAHVMHSEWGAIDGGTAEALNAARAARGRIVSVGTTSARILESAADEGGRIRPFAGETAIFISPGYRFRATDVLMTNFHLPRSTLFMLVSAFSGLETMKAAYAHAVDSSYRFYSYGDACLLIGARDADRPTA
ncbi:tRNA preQ1(34) S-adenosylmethionine ribosyltransferase-isomerase QueA [Roseiarcus sp.]|uniref:tRNA preQ1(34) S-adenosylmethionine ribosyltransferase-isomerase QueA n=1 Tax=Roseiarcus sp. TaxID=1969460 RepID=UPI003F99FD37